MGDELSGKGQHKRPPDPGKIDKNGKSPSKSMIKSRDTSVRYKINYLNRTATNSKADGKINEKPNAKKESKSSERPATPKRKNTSPLEKNTESSVWHMLRNVVRLM